MRLYSGTTKSLIEDSTYNRIATKLRDAFFLEFRYQPAVAEVNSWNNSLRAVSQVFQTASLLAFCFLIRVTCYAASLYVIDFICALNLGEAQGKMAATITERTVHALEILKEEEIAAPINAVFETILEHIGPKNEAPGVGPIPVKLEAWPGGRWVSRSRKRRGTLLGQRAGNQAANTTRDLRTFVYVVSRRFERAVRAH